jgi:hypothetical protein
VKHVRFLNQSIRSDGNRAAKRRHSHFLQHVAVSVRDISRIRNGINVRCASPPSTNFVAAVVLGHVVLRCQSFFRNVCCLPSQQGQDERSVPGNTVAVQADMPFNGLTKFGTAFLSKFECSQLPHAVSPGKKADVSLLYLSRLILVLSLMILCGSNIILVPDQNCRWMHLMWHLQLSNDSLGRFLQWTPQL